MIFRGERALFLIHYILYFFVKHFSTTIWDCYVTVNKSCHTNVLQCSCLEIWQKKACGGVLSLVKFSDQKIPNILMWFPSEHFPKMVERNLNYILHFFKINADDTKLKPTNVYLYVLLLLTKHKQVFKACDKKRKKCGICSK